MFCFSIIIFLLFFLFNYIYRTLVYLTFKDQLFPIKCTLQHTIWYILRINFCIIVFSKVGIFFNFLYPAFSFPHTLQSYYIFDKHNNLIINHLFYLFIFFLFSVRLSAPCQGLSHSSTLKSFSVQNGKIENRKSEI